MGTLEDIRKMQQEGYTEQDIINSLAEKGIPYSEINNSLAQTKIKQAVDAPAVMEDSSASAPMPKEQTMTQLMSQTQGMQPSVLGSESQEAQKTEDQSDQAEQPAPSQQQQEQPQQPQQEFAPPAYPEEQQSSYPQDYNQYPQYQSYPQYGTEADAISDIAEQVLLEKISPLKSKIEAVLDLRSILETKISLIDDRVKRIEKIIDRLELSILQKVGSQLQNIEDIKSEMIETQKSFKSLLNKKTTSSSTNFKDNYKEII
ncbi:hypothetical protein HYW75_05455 [Candidatus Pacearchaeota archaeon]|nr:hypothetical protein [Candidatus Pacearchaeota archaeon]